MDGGSGLGRGRRRVIREVKVLLAWVGDWYRGAW
jgi:hypothetical protein